LTTISIYTKAKSNFNWQLYLFYKAHDSLFSLKIKVSLNISLPQKLIDYNKPIKENSKLINTTKYIKQRSEKIFGIIHQSEAKN